MLKARWETLDPFLTPRQADEMLRLCEEFGSYRCYSEDATNTVPLAPGVPQRFDAAANFVRTGGRFGRKEDPRVLASRTNYFRETYAYDGRICPGIETILHHEGLARAARRIHSCALVVPNIVYANILVPGQELAVHTDVPEFRGANRKLFPQWLMVVMLHSGLFDRWRLRVATGISYIGSCRGGELAYYPAGPRGPVYTLPAKHNSAVVLDTDRVFHGVDRVAESQPLPDLRPGAQLCFEGAGRWRVGCEEKPLAHYRWEELRFSISWKAYCYQDAAERRLVEEHRDDLSLDQILETLRADLRRRGRLEQGELDEDDLALTLIDEYVHFPPATP